MVDFELFCEIKEYLNVFEITTQAVDENISLKQIDNTIGFSGSFLNSDKESDETAIITLIDSCNKEMIQRLITYFDSEAPIQKLLNKRLSELSSTQENEIEIGNFLKSESKNSQSFYQYLTVCLEKSEFKTDADFYNYIGMSRQTFSKIRKNNAVISRDNALLMAVGLRLNYSEAVDFLNNAGYAFRKGNRREAIISYVMKNKKYDLWEMEEILLSFNEKPLLDID